MTDRERLIDGLKNLSSLDLSRLEKIYEADSKKHPENSDYAEILSAVRQIISEKSKK